MSGVPEDEFYELMIAPGFPDEMNFQIEVPPENRDGERTFSFEGIDGIADRVRDFMLARVHGKWKRSGVPPTALRVHVSLSWDGMTQEQLAKEDPPWYAAGDHGGTLFDGEYRKRAAWN